MPTVRAVLFDFYGTLAHAESWGPSYEDVLAGHGVTLHDDVRRRWVSDAFDGLEHVEHSVDRDTYVAWEKRRLVEMVTACGVGADDATRLADDLWDAGKQWTMRPFPETESVLRGLQARGVAVVVCSNWDWDIERALDAAEVGDLIDVAVTSARAGARKPHRRIFDHTLDRARVTDPSSVVFVGDSWGPDVEGPREMGMRPVHVWRPEWDGEREPPPVTNGIVRLPDLTGLVDLV